ncbi:MAG: acyltransferase [Actinomycetota bacterium]
MRAVAVVAILATHLAGWPRGGFLGVDVFFVISGFFVTDMLLRSAEPTGTVSLGRFWLDRARRILPLAVVVLLLAYLASLALLPSQSHAIGIDALYSLVFLANWHFAFHGADASTAVGADSPLQHYWPLAIEEQFYLVWPILILAVTALVVHRAWTRTHWFRVVAAASGLVTAGSLAWAAASPQTAHFNTFARVWELGLGALLATAVGTLALTPVWLKPILSWTGVALIAASVVLVSPASENFPVPWAFLPVLGAALVIAAGVGGEPLFQPLLRNRAATYVGDLSYALYLVHWPVIVLLATAMETTVYFYASAVTLTLGVAIALHHFVEEPLRQANWEAVRQARRDMKHGLYHVERSTKVAAVAALVLITLSVITFAARPDRYQRAHADPCCGHVE